MDLEDPVGFAVDVGVVGEGLDDVLCVAGDYLGYFRFLYFRRVFDGILDVAVWLGGVPVFIVRVVHVGSSVLGFA